MGIGFHSLPEAFSLVCCLRGWKPQEKCEVDSGTSHWTLQAVSARISALDSVGMKACVLCCGVGRTRKLRQMSPDSAAWEPLPFGEDELVR